ncbi:unnamed protein product [Rotaria sp. Silwood2]|nr:unnamed protein product [Rotaria sp. Silwood2]CAF3398534.1 unnamed protein product [Rotaria sp. Silwood2]
MLVIRTMWPVIMLPNSKKTADYKFNSSYILNGLTIAQLAAKDNYRLLRQSVDCQRWTFPPTKIEAAYNPSLNSICEILFSDPNRFFSFGFINLFCIEDTSIMAVSIDLLRYEKKQQISHTAIGSTMGHEITHGFDIIGRQYDENGNVVPWWINEKIDAYNKQIECFIQQYSNYTVPGVNRQVFLFLCI